MHQTEGNHDISRHSFMHLSISFITSFSLIRDIEDGWMDIFFSSFRNIFIQMTSMYTRSYLLMDINKSIYYSFNDQ